jgi:hypothetical protein
MTPVPLLALALVALAAPLAAQDLIPSPPLAPNVDALPRLDGDTVVARQINAALQMLDEQDLQSVTCEGEDPENASRSVKVLSDGPEFLSLLLSSGGACEGSNYPFSMTELLNFDLETGGQIDLLQFLPDGWADRINAYDPDNDPLLALYLEMAGEEVRDQCQDTLMNGSISFEFGLDGQEGQLLILPDGLLHIELGCENAVSVPVERLKAVGFHPRLIESLRSTP